MRSNIHPTYYTDAQVICSCGNTWTTGSTRKVIRTDVCSKCHPFFTGEQRIVDYRRSGRSLLQETAARQQFMADREARETARTSLDRPIAELELGTRATDALAKAGIENVGQILEKLSEGETGLLAIDGFGRKSLADLKKRCASSATNCLKLPKKSTSKQRSFRMQTGRWYNHLPVFFFSLPAMHSWR